MIANTGNTHGIRLRIRPPSRAAPRAHAHVPQPESGGAGLMRVLDSNAACSAGNTAAGAATAGHVPSTTAVVTRLWPPSTRTMGKVDGLWDRSADSGTRADQTAPFQLWLLDGPAVDVSDGDAAVSMISVVSGNRLSRLPCQSGGRPLTAKVRPSADTVALAGPSKGLGWASRAASNAAPCRAVEPRTGRRNTKWPSCGMHSCRHTSQVAKSLTSKVPPRGWKPGVMVSGTGSSTVPS